MERSKSDRTKGGLIFWILLIASLAIPASAAIKKELYSARIMSGGRGVGSAMLVHSNQGNPEYMVRTNAQPNQSVVKAGLQSVDGSWGVDIYGSPKQIVLCENGGVSGNCTYASDGNLDITGVVNGPMLGLAGVSVSQFVNSLQRNVGQTTNIKVVLNDGNLGSGPFARVF